MPVKRFIYTVILCIWDGDFWNGKEEERVLFTSPRDAEMYAKTKFPDYKSSIFLAFHHSRRRKTTLFIIEKDKAGDNPEIQFNESEKERLLMDTFMEMKEQDAELERVYTHNTTLSRLIFSKYMKFTNRIK